MADDARSSRGSRRPRPLDSRVMVDLPADVKAKLRAFRESIDDRTGDRGECRAREAVAVFSVAARNALQSLEDYSYHNGFFYFEKR